MDKVFIEVEKVIDADINKNRKSEIKKEFIRIDEIKSFRNYNLTDEQRTEFPTVKSMTLIYFMNKKPEVSSEKKSEEIPKYFVHKDPVPQARIAEEVSSFGKRVGSIEL